MPSVMRSCARCASAKRSATGRSRSFPVSLRASVSRSTRCAPASKRAPTVKPGPEAGGAMGISGRIARFFLESRLTPLIALVALLLGAFAVFVTPREEEPQINVTMANVLIPFPGASAKDVETLVAIPAEQVMSQIHGLEHVF